MGKLLDHQDRIKEGGAGAAPPVGDLNAHDAELEEAVDQVPGHDPGLVHVVHPRADLLDGEVAHALLEQLLLFGEDCEWRAWRDINGLGGHRGASGNLGRIIADV